MKNQNIILAAAMIAALTVPGIQSMAADPSVPAEYSGNAHEFGEYEEFLPEEEWEEQTEYWLDDDVNTTNYYDIIRSYSEVTGLFKGKNLSIEPLMKYLEYHETPSDKVYDKYNSINQHPNDRFDKWDDDYLAYAPFIMPASYAWTDDDHDVIYTLRKSVSGDTDINATGMYVEIMAKEGIKHAPGDKFDPADYDVVETYAWLDMFEEAIPEENCQLYLINKDLQVTDTYEKGANLVIAAIWPSREFVYKTRMRYWGIGEKDGYLHEKSIGGPTASTLYLGIVVNADRPISSDGKYLDEVDDNDKETTVSKEKVNKDEKNDTETTSVSQAPEKSKGVNPAIIIIPVIVIAGAVLLIKRKK